MTRHSTKPIIFFLFRNDVKDFVHRNRQQQEESFCLQRTNFESSIMMMNRAAAIRVAAAQGGCLLMKSRGVCSQSALSRLHVVSAANKVFLGSKPTTTPFQDDSGRRWISSSKDAPVFDYVGVIGLGLMGHGICQTVSDMLSQAN
jgi:hypothetical protein